VELVTWMKLVGFLQNAQCSSYINHFVYFDNSSVTWGAGRGKLFPLSEDTSGF